MKFIADFHIHSKYSRATSPDMDLEMLDKWAKIKGIDVLGSGDFTHPAWMKNIEENLRPSEDGLYVLRNCQKEKSTRFLLTSEISCIYTKNSKVRKIHILIFAPSIEIAKKINSELEKNGNIAYDGRPIIGIDAEELAKIIFNISSDCLVIPAHAWTPWFSIFGSRSGFDSIEECFGKFSKYINAIETGLSSDPQMNWRLSMLDNITLISNSDSHSPSKIGREANVFDTEMSFQAIHSALKEKDPKKFLYTVEFFPEEGKYHYDGHALCKASFNPEETKKHRGICPVCKKPLVVGVLSRVSELADRESGVKPKNAIPYKNLIPLSEIIADTLGVGIASKKVSAMYFNLIEKLGNEFYILMEADENELNSVASKGLSDAILSMRKGEVDIKPGYDGVYGKISVKKANNDKNTIQKPLF